MKKLKIKLFQRTYRLLRRYVRWSHHEYRTDEDKLSAKRQYEALYDFIVDSGLEQEYCDWRASLSEEAMDAA